MSPNDESTSDNAETPERKDHEETDVDPGQIGRGVLGIAAGVVVCLAVLAFGYAALSGISVWAVFTPTTEDIETPRPPEPRLESEPYKLRREAEAAARRQLETYSWKQREGEIARIPIERAMELVVERHQNDRPAQDRPGPDGGAPDAGREGDSGEPHETD